MAQEFANALGELDRWFERQKRLLPWRDEPSLYRVWISEIMLQQTQVVTVIPYFERFISCFPTVEALAQASEDEVMKNWAGLGYYSRARNLHRAAKKIAAEGFPRTREGWLEIPGVGEYTAGAILSIALNQPEAILDGNVERVLSRVRRVSRVRGDAAFKQRLWRLSRAFVGRAHGLGLRPSSVNQALMELGATFCSVRGPKCLLCPLQSLCRASRVGDAESFPPKKKRKQWLQVREEVHCVLDAGGRCLVEKRAKGQWRAGLWDLPETLEAVGYTADSVKALTKVGEIESRHIVTRHKITRLTHVWKLKKSGEWKAAEPDAAPGAVSGLRWISAREPEVAVGSALRKSLQQMFERFSEL